MADIAGGPLAGRRALVTGAASGIGRACALQLAEAGADLVLIDLQDEGLVDVSEATEAAGAETFARSMDVSNEAAWDSLMQEIDRRRVILDIGVSAAGVSHGLYGVRPPRGSVNDAGDPRLINKPTEHWHRVLRINLDGTMFADRAVARHFVKHGREGALVNIASISSWEPIRGAGDYCVSKAGVWMLTKVLALELAEDGIRVNAVAPGYTETKMTASLQASDRHYESVLRSIPLGTFAEPGDIAAAVLFLVSHAARHITGEVICVDGGSGINSR